LRYREWVEQKRDYVAKASGGRLGYVHMFDMSANALSQLHVDLDAENQTRQGVVVDVRNNNGGFVNVYAIDVFARRGYFNMHPRPVDVAVTRPVGESYTGKDVQLDTAVAELLKQLGGATRTDSSRRGR